jgi:hypothetical protein
MLVLSNNMAKFFRALNLSPFGYLCITGQGLQVLNSCTTAIGLK